MILQKKKKTRFSKILNLFICVCLCVCVCMCFYATPAFENLYIVKDDVFRKYVPVFENFNQKTNN